MKILRQYFIFFSLLLAFATFLLWPISRVLQVAFFGTGEGGKQIGRAHV